MILLWPDHQEYDKITITPGIDNQSVLGIFPGKKENHKQHTHINEDVIAQKRITNNRILSMLADGHHGKETAENIIACYPEIIEESLKKNSNIHQALFISLILLNAKILREKTLKNMYYHQDNSASTFLTTIQTMSELYYMSVGDSYIYLIDKKWKAAHINEQQINHDNPLYIGDVQDFSFQDSIYDILQQINHEKNTSNEEEFKKKNNRILNPFGSAYFDAHALKPVIHIGKYDIKNLKDKTMVLSTDGIEKERTGINIQDLIYTNKELLNGNGSTHQQNLHIFTQRLLETFQKKEGKLPSDNISLIIQSF